MGATGPQGPAGLACWDLNGNGTGDVPAEDINGDTVVNVSDCTGLQGPQGIQGIQGPQGIQGIQGPQGLTGPAGTARAYATIDPTTSPTFIIAARSSNIVSVARPSTGVYCITPAAGISPSDSASFVTVEWGNSVGNELFAYNVDLNTFQCAANEFAVRTYSGSPPTLSNSVGFQILIP